MIADGARPADIVAVQDRDCIDRAKFRYALPAPLPKAFFTLFSDAKVVIREFSKIVPNGRDLFCITKPLAFRADGIVGDDKLVVSFHGDPQDWPEVTMEDFGRRLRDVGYSRITYTAGAAPRCLDCSLRFLKNCRGNRSDPAAAL